MTSGRQIQIAEIGLDSQRHLFVRPSVDDADAFTFVWRDASGVRWSPKLQVLHALEPERWNVTALYQKILVAIRREYGTKLLITRDTRWSGIPHELRTAIEALPSED